MTVALVECVRDGTVALESAAARAEEASGRRARGGGVGVRGGASRRVYASIETMERRRIVERTDHLESALCVRRAVRADAGRVRESR